MRVSKMSNGVILRSLGRPPHRSRCLAEKEATNAVMGNCPTETEATYSRSDHTMNPLMSIPSSRTASNISFR